MLMKDMQDIKKKSDAELAEFIESERATLRSERFKDAFSRKAGTIRAAKLNIARALTEQTARRKSINA